MVKMVHCMLCVFYHNKKSQTHLLKKNCTAFVMQKGEIKQKGSMRKGKAKQTLKNPLESVLNQSCLLYPQYLCINISF